MITLKKGMQLNFSFPGHYEVGTVIRVARDRSWADLKYTFIDGSSYSVRTSRKTLRYMGLR